MDASKKIADASSRSKIHRPLPWLNLMVTEPFYLLHLLTFFSYFAARTASDTVPRLLRREMQAGITFLVVTVIKMIKEETWESFIADTLLYLKGFLLALALIIDYHLALCYLVVFLVIFVSAQQPPYEGLGDASHLTPLQLETLLTEGGTSRYWLVEFRSMCSSTCVRTSSVFPDLSVIYSNKSISFGIVDLGHFPNAAEKYGIPLGGPLPSYILFDSATEVARYPDLNSDPSAATITKNIICRYFELDRRLVEYISSK